MIGINAVLFVSLDAIVYGPAHHFRLVCRNCDAGVLCLGGPKPMVCFGIRRGLRGRISLWVPPSRRLAVWIGRSGLVPGRVAAMVAEKPIGGSIGDKVTGC